jgi:hypothetical protein
MAASVTAPAGCAGNVADGGRKRSSVVDFIGAVVERKRLFPVTAYLYDAGSRPLG